MTALVMVLSPLKIVGHCLKALLEVMTMETQEDDVGFLVDEG
jgi:hypothetical protein